MRSKNRNQRELTMGSVSEIVISGIGGRYPGANNTEELWQTLLEGKDVIEYVEDPNRSVLNTPKYKGILNMNKEFDNMLFGIHNRLAVELDRNTCFIQEVAFAAICDAGVNPYEIGGKQIAVIVASGCSKLDFYSIADKANNGFSLLGGSQCMMANRLSHALNLKGPSYNLDGSWNGFVGGLKYAKSIVSKGIVDAAIVGCTSINKLNEYSFHFKQIGRLTDDSKTKCFSDDADGYVRAEACVVFFIQRKEDANRIYGTIIDIVAGDNFNKDLPLGDLDCKIAAQSIRSLYEKYPDISKKVSYIECSGEALKFWDKVELNSISEVLLPEKDKPLLIGSVKSNIGHTEDAAAGVAMVKALLSFDRGIIPPNLHYSAPNKDIPALVSGKMKVVTQPTKMEGDIIGINTFRVDGSLSHVIIRRNPKVKKRDSKVGVLPHGIPILFTASARNDEGIKYILKKVEEMPIDEEFVALGNKLFRNVIRHYAYRGYTILNENANVVNEVKVYNFYKKPIWWVFSGMGSQWVGMGKSLMNIPIFANAIYKCHEILIPHGINIIDIITATDASIFDSILNSFVGIAAIQIGLVDILNAVGLVPDGLLGHSVGELGCAYGDGCFTAEQMILAAYARGKASLDADLIPGMMAAVGMGYNEIKDKVPEGIDVACHNSSTSCTLSGPAELMEEYIASIKAEGIFAKLVNASNIAYHSRYIQPAAPALLESLKQVIPDPKKRSSKWISTSVLAKDWDAQAAMYSSAEYHTNNLLGSVLFEEASDYVPKDAIIVEIAPHGLLQPILKKSLPDATHISLTHRAEPDGAIYLLSALGKLYLEGVGLDIDKLYPPIQFPVSRGTPSLEPFVFWNHNSQVKKVLATGEDYSKNIVVKFDNVKYTHLKEYAVNGQHLISPAVYLDLIIEHIQNLNGTKGPLVLEEFQMKCNPNIINNQCQFQLCLENGSGSWELSQENKVISMGRHMNHKDALLMEELSPVDGITLTKEEIFSYLHNLGVEIGRSSRVIESLTFSDEEGIAQVLWDGNLITFMDNILLLPLLLDNEKCSKLRILFGIQRFTIDVDYFNSQPKKVFKVSFEKKSNTIWCEGLEVSYPQLKSTNVPKTCSKEVIYNTLQFLPYSSSNQFSLDELLENSIEVILQNIMVSTKVPKINIIELLEGLSLHKQIMLAIKKRNGIKADIRIVGSSENVKEYRFEDNYDCSLIVSDSKNVGISEQFLKQIKQGYLLLINQTPPSSLSIVMEQKSESHSFHLCKLKSNLNSIADFIMLSEEGWKKKLDKTLSANVNNIVHLVGNSTSLPEIYTRVTECDKIYNSMRLRYMFFEEEIVDFNPTKYTSQFEKDNKILIYQNGEWGTYRMNSNIFNNTLNLSYKKTFPFSNMSCPGIKLTALGVNLGDVSGSSKKLRIIEYVGEKDGVKVCGLATLLDDSVILDPDKELFWNIPKTWIDCEIASVLLPYSMAYYILKVDNPSFVKGDKIYVNHASHPLAQAIIVIALRNELNVFTSYKDIKEKDWIKSSFPEIPEDNIISLDHKSVDVTVMKYHGSKMKIVLNLLPEADMLESLLHILDIEGKFYQISLSPMKSDEKIGMFTFLNQIVVIGLSPESFMMIPNHLKEQLRSLVAFGLQSREIKPLAAKELRSDDLNIDAVSLLLDKCSLPQKVVINMENKHKNNSPLNTCYRTMPHKCYLIIGDTRNFWIHICQWLVKRGAQNIYLVLRKSVFTISSSQQFSSLLLMNPFLNLNLMSLMRMKDKDSIDSTLKEINACDNLAAVFCIGKENEDTAKCLLETKENFLVVSLCAGGEAECENRAISGLPSLAICTSDYILKKNIILPVLDHLITQEKSVVYVSEQEGLKAEVHDLTMAEHFQSIPSSPEDILQLVNNVKKAVWKEVRTSSFITIHSRELDPIFILTSLKKSYMEKIMQSLLHPAYEAIIPSDSNITDIAKNLTNEIIHKFRFKHNEVTIICSDWAWPLALVIAQYLEVEEKKVCIIALDSTVRRTSKSVVQNYISDIKWKLLECQDKNISKGIRILESRVDLMYFSLKDVLTTYKGLLHIVKPDSEENCKINDLEQFCEKQIWIHSIPSTSFSNMLKEKKTVDLINSLILFEYKIPGKTLNKQYFEKNIVDCTWQSFDGLERVD